MGKNNKSPKLCLGDLITLSIIIIHVPVITILNIVLYFEGFKGGGDYYRILWES
jgi:hypothetical protein